MWPTAMAVNSFVVWPVTFIFLVYSIGRAVLFFEWKLLVLAIFLFALSSAAQMALGILSDSGH